MKKNNLILIILTLLAIVLIRLIPHAPNFSPLASILLFSGVYTAKKRYVILPLVALFISDLFLGFYAWPIMLTVYLSFAVIGLLGIFLKKRKNILNTISSSLGAGLLFFLVTNFAVWYFGTWYSHDLAGLSLCYTLAIPFFKNTIMSNLLYTSVLFGAYEGCKYFIKEKILVNNN